MHTLIHLNFTLFYLKTIRGPQFFIQGKPQIPSSGLTGVFIDIRMQIFNSIQLPISINLSKHIFAFFGR